MGEEEGNVKRKGFKSFSSPFYILIKEIDLHGGTESDKKEEQEKACVRRVGNKCTHFTQEGTYILAILLFSHI